MARSVDVLVVGSGAAGLTFALRAAEFCDVCVVTKDRRDESNSAYAQGGIAAVWDDDDRIEDHLRDTLIAGAGLCRPEVVETTVREGPDRVRDLIKLGAQFTRSDSEPTAYDLHQEGGHSRRRILHAADLTGREIVRALVAACEAHPRVEIREAHLAVDILTRRWLARRDGTIPPEDDEVLGAYVLDLRSGEVEVIAARCVVLATGGAGMVYLHTTNPSVATGDGMAMGWRAGARMANMEFVQFHPTTLYHPRAQGFLISEALRGEGGRLILPNGTPFMAEHDPRADLAPRDIVARAIDAELKRRGLEHVGLDMTHLAPGGAERKFPNIHAHLLQLGIDMTKEPIPVVPAAHYFCGGVQTDLHGESSIARLFAVGETACTGLHGANRLASNSLLEAIVFAHRAADRAKELLRAPPAVEKLPEWDAGSAVDSDELVVLQHTWEEIRRLMWNYVGIVRTHRRLKRAERRIELVQEEIQRYYWDFKVTGRLIEVRNIVMVAEMVVACALRRQESRGLHTMVEFPRPDSRFIRDTVVHRAL